LGDSGSARRATFCTFQAMFCRYARPQPTLRSPLGCLRVRGNPTCGAAFRRRYLQAGRVDRLPTGAKKGPRPSKQIISRRRNACELAGDLGELHQDLVRRHHGVLGRSLGELAAAKRSARCILAVVRRTHLQDHGEAGVRLVANGCQSGIKLYGRGSQRCHLAAT
jgi:hypothetical protein